MATSHKGVYAFELGEPRQVAEQLLALTGRKLTVFVGAYVSARAPSHLPTAGELKDAFIAELWRGVRSRLAPRPGATPRSLLRGSRWAELPLELVAESVLVRAELRVDELLAFIGVSAPNKNHAALATLLDHGLAHVVTTNFDELIEKRRRPRVNPKGLTKLHGTFSSPDEMAIRLSQVGRGVVRPPARQRLVRALRGRDVCFVGYSGRDPDIRPILRAEQIRTVLWIARPPRPGESTAEVEAEHQYVARLFKSGTPVRCTAVDADRVFDELSHRLNVGPVPTHPSVRWRQRIRAVLQGVPWQRQALALGDLFARSGELEFAQDIFEAVESARVPPRDKARAALDHMAASYHLQEYEVARASGSRAVKRFRRLRDDDGLARAYQLLGLIAERSSVRGKGWASRYMRKSLDLHAAGSPNSALIGVQLDLGTWLKNRGRFNEAEATQRAALQQARALGDIPHQGRIHLAIGILRGHQRHRALVEGDRSTANRLAASARYHLTRARSTAAFLGETSNELRCVNALIALELDTRVSRFRAGVADRLIDEAEELASRTPEPDQRNYVAIERGDWLNRVGRPREGIAILTEAAKNARSTAFLAEALIERARAHLMLGNPNAAWADVSRAKALAPVGPRRATADALLAEIAAN